MAKDKFLQRYKEKFPDKDYEANPDELWNDADAEYEELNAYKAKNSEVNKKLIGVLNSHPEVADFIRDIAKGAPVSEALARNFDLENITPVEGDPDYEAWTKGSEERAMRNKEREEYGKTFDSNLEASGKAINSFIEKNGLDEAQADEFMKSVDAIFKDAIDGKIEESTLTALYTAANHEQVVKDEVDKATVKAKNEKIEAEMEKEDMKGDGLPHATGGESITPAKPTTDDPWMKAIDTRKKF